MRLSQYFLPVLKENPAEAQIDSHNLMLRAGMIKQSCAGIYNWLPLGVKVLNNIETIVKKNMNLAGCIEVRMPCMQPTRVWKESGRYDDYGQEMLKIYDRHNHEMIFGPTNEEVVTEIFRQTIKSYKELPKILYQIQWKFRDEIRPRFGVMRSREFLMKDAYSFDVNSSGALKSYNIMYHAYLLTFQDLGLKVIPVQADNGPIGGDLSHEFHVLSNVGESQILYDKRFDESKNIDLNTIKSLYAVTEEKYKAEDCPISPNHLVTKRGIEVGQIFLFGTKYTDSMKAYVTDQEGKSIAPHMGSYGIGISRLVGAIIEANHDKDGIIWPKNIAPFKVSIVNLLASNQEAITLSSHIYQTITEKGIDVLYDDTDHSPGSKLKTNDLIGTPYQIIIGKRSSEAEIEFKNRYTGKVSMLSVQAVIDQLVKELKNAA